MKISGQNMGVIKKGVRTRSLRIKFSDGPKHQILTREIKKHQKWKRNRTYIYNIILRKTTMFNVHSKQQTTYNIQRLVEKIETKA